LPLLNLEENGNIFKEYILFATAGNQLPNYTASKPRKQHYYYY
jgi:hypothetical protein